MSMASVEIRFTFLANSWVYLSDKIIGQQQNVRTTFPQRRQEDGEHIEAVIEVGTKGPLVDFFFQVLVGSGDDAHIHAAPFVDDPSGWKVALLKDTQQLGLGNRGKFSHLIQERWSRRRLPRSARAAG